MKLALLFFGLIAAYLLIGWLISFPIQLRSYTLSSPKIKTPVRLAVVSDLHSTVYGPNQKRLLDKLRQSRCDLILMPGDIIDDIKPLRGAELFLDQAAAIAPCYYCTGNHENIDTLITLPEVKARVRQAGITVLDSRKETITIRGTRFTLCGIDDPRKYAYIDRDSQEEIELMKALGSVQTCPEYTILLAHRPERPCPWRTGSNSRFDQRFVCAPARLVPEAGRRFVSGTELGFNRFPGIMPAMVSAANLQSG